MPLYLPLSTDPGHVSSAPAPFPSPVFPASSIQVIRVEHVDPFSHKDVPDMVSSTYRPRGQRPISNDMKVSHQRFRPGSKFGVLLTGLSDPSDVHREPVSE